MAALTADAVWEVFRWLDAGDDWRWLALLFAERHDLRRPLMHLPLVELLDRREDAFALVQHGGCSMFELALAEGHASAARRHVPPAVPRESVLEAFRSACTYGHLDLAKWLVARFELTPADARARANHAFRGACANGHLDLAKWLTAHFGLTAEDARASANWAFRRSCERGHLDLAKWLTARFGLTPADAGASANEASRRARMHGHLEVAAWLAATWP